MNQNPTLNQSRFFINPPHRTYSQSEMKELAALIKTYVDLSPTATNEQLNEGLIILSELYDSALQLRYGLVKSI